MNLSTINPMVRSYVGQSVQASSLATSQQVRFGSLNDVSPYYSKALRKFGFNLFQQVAKEGLGGKNAVFSPLSMGIALAMVLNGASEQTKVELEDALETHGLTVDEVNKAIKTYTAAVGKLDSNVTVKTANALWTGSYPIEAPFQKTLETEYGAQVVKVNFDNAKATLDKINKFFSDNTNGLIPKMLEEFDPNTIAALGNAVYLNAKWRSPFNASDNYEADFTTSKGVNKVNMMTQDGNFQYNDFAAEGFEAIKLPYGENKSLSMVVLLPKKGTSLEKLAEKLNGNNWNAWSNKLDSRNMDFVRISLPKHEVEYDLQAKEAMQALGVQETFQEGVADFSKIFGFKKPAITELKHKAVIKVNEEGTEAAAATYAGFGLESCVMPREPEIHMNVDHGFITVIQDDTTHSPLFITTVDDPKFIESKEGSDLE